MTKKGFTLMELLVSIFITGMVMLSLVAMWKTSSNQTAQAQRQSIIRNEGTMFLRKVYADFVSASEIICPWGYSYSDVNISCSGYNYLAVKDAVLDSNDNSKLVRITGKLCDDNWATETNLNTMTARCIKPYYVAYKFNGGSGPAPIYRCTNSFLDGDDKSITINTLKNDVASYCNDSSHPERWEIIMPYVQNFSLSIPSSGNSKYPEILVDYTVKREFTGDIPPVYFKFKRYLTKKRGV